MKYASTFRYVQICALSILMEVTSTQARLVMTVLLNNGTLPTAEGYTCTANDSMMIQKIIGSDEDEEDGEDRRSNLRKSTRKLPSYCRDACRGYVSGSCHVTGCLGYRRRKNRSLTMSTNRELDDEDSVICADGLVKLNQELDFIIPKLSVNCRPVLQSMRVVSCFDDVRYAAVNSFTLWDATNDSIVQSNIQNNTSFCYNNNTWNIEAVANACVEKIYIKVSGPISTSREIETTTPYSIFRNVGDTDILGRKFPVGKYTVQTKLEGSMTPTSKVTFIVKAC
jgi:hypothetical protein